MSRAGLLDGGKMSLTGHLKELRNRIFVCAGWFLIWAIVFLAIADKLVDLLTAMGIKYGYQFIAIAPQEKMLQYFKLSLVAALIVTIPVIMYEAWAFARPGLKKREYRFFGFTMLFGLLLFGVGVLFAYTVSLPFMLNFLNSLGGADYIVGSYSIESYIDFVVMVFTVFGCVFEMPLLSVILAKLGIASPQIMRKGRGVAIVIIFTVAAIITPPDVFSQVMVAIPMIALYELSILLCGIFYKQRITAPKDDEDEDDDEDDDDDDDADTKSDKAPKKASV